MKAGPRILVVEDDRSIARLVQLELEHSNFAVRCAYDGPSGLEAVSDFKPAVIILDIMLPKLNGVGVATSYNGRMTPQRCFSGRQAGRKNGAVGP